LEEKTFFLEKMKNGMNRPSQSEGKAETACGGIKRVLLVCTAFAAVAALGACRPTLDLTPVDSSDGRTDGHTYLTASNSYADIFKAFWQGMDTNYVFWDVEPTGYWDEVWNTYKPKFDALGAYNVTDTSESAKAQVTAARKYIQEMVDPLQDGHLNVRFEYYSPLDLPPYSSDSPWSYSPSATKVYARYPLDSSGHLTNNDPYDTFFKSDTLGDMTNNFWSRTIAPNYVTGTPLTATVGGNDPIRMATGTIAFTGPGAVAGDHIRYLYFSNFDINANLSNSAENRVNLVVNTYLADLRNSDCRGVIFDLRGNRGGANIDIPLLLSPLLTSDLTFAHERLKKGAARLDYMPWVPYIIKANSAGIWRAANAGTIPVVALVDDYSISCGELMPLGVQAMPKGRIIGTRTWGATGPRRSDATPSATHGGSFTHNKLWTRVVQAGYQTRGLHFENYEGEGVPPDDEVPFDLAKFNAGEDVQLQKAIDYVNSH
jgi:C-terminal processing protease CtpA/Prc